MMIFLIFLYYYFIFYFLIARISMDVYVWLFLGFNAKACFSIAYCFIEIFCKINLK